MAFYGGKPPSKYDDEDDEEDDDDEVKSSKPGSYSSGPSRPGLGAFASSSGNAGKKDDRDDKRNDPPKSGTPPPKPGSVFGSSNTPRPGSPAPGSGSGSAFGSGQGSGNKPPDQNRPGGSGGSTGAFGRPGGATPSKPDEKRDDAPKPGAFSGGFGRPAGNNPTPAKADDKNDDPPKTGGGLFGRPAGNNPTPAKADDKKDDPPKTGGGLFGRPAGNAPTPAKADDKKDDPPKTGGGLFARPGGNAPVPATKADPKKDEPAKPATGGGVFGRLGSGAKADDKPTDKKDDAPKPAGGGIFGRLGGGGNKPDDKDAKDTGKKDAPASTSGGSNAPRPGNVFGSGNKPSDPPKQEAAKPAGGGFQSSSGSFNRPGTPSGGSSSGSSGSSGSTSGGVTSGGSRPLSAPFSSSPKPNDPKPAKDAPPAPKSGFGGGLFNRGQAGDAPKDAPKDAKKGSAPAAQSGGGFNIRGMFNRGAADVPPAKGGKPTSAPSGGKKIPAAAPPSRIDGKQAKPLDKANMTQVKVKRTFSRDQQLDVVGIALVAFGAIIFFGLLSPIDPNAQSAYITGTIVRILGQLFGYGRYVLFLPCFAVGGWLIVRHFGDRTPEIEYTRIIGWGLMFLALTATFQQIELFQPPVPTLDALAQSSSRAAQLTRGGGLVGDKIYMVLMYAVGDYATFVFLIGWWIIAVMLAFEITLAEITEYAKSVGRWIFGVQSGFNEGRQRAQAARELRQMEAQKAQGLLVTAPESGTPALSAGRGGKLLAASTAPPPPPAQAKLKTGTASAVEPTPLPVAVSAPPTSAPEDAPQKRGFSVGGLFSRSNKQPEPVPVAAPVSAAGLLSKAESGSVPVAQTAAPAPIATIAPAEPAKAPSAAGLFGGKPAPETVAPKPGSRPEVKPADAPAKPSPLGMFSRGTPAKSDPPQAADPVKADAPPTDPAKAEPAKPSPFGLFSRGNPSQSNPADPVKTPEPVKADGKPSNPLTAASQTSDPAERPPAAPPPAPAKPGTFGGGLFGARTGQAQDAAKPADPVKAEPTKTEVIKPDAPKPSLFGRPDAPKPTPTAIIEPDDKPDNTPTPQVTTPMKPAGLGGSSAFGTSLAAKADMSAAPSITPAPPAAPASSPFAPKPPPSAGGLFGSRTPDAQAKPTETPKPAEKAPDKPAPSPFGSRPELKPSTVFAADKAVDEVDDLDDGDDEDSDAVISAKPSDRPSAAFAPAKPPGAGLFGGGRPANTLTQGRDSGKFDPKNERRNDRRGGFDEDEDEDFEDEEEDLIDMKPATPKSPAPFGSRPSAPLPFASKSKPSPKPGAAFSLTDDEAGEDDEDEEDSDDSPTYVPLDDTPAPARPPSPFGSKPSAPSPFGSRPSQPSGQVGPRPFGGGATPSRPSGAPLSNASNPATPAPDKKADTPTTPAPPVMIPAPAASITPTPMAAPLTPAIKPPDPVIAAPVTSAPALPPEPVIVRSNPPGTWTMPDYSQLLERGSEAHADEEYLKERAAIIEETLQSFGAPGKVVEINAGPVITQFGVEPDYLVSRQGKKTRVKVSSIAKLDSDLALSLAARTIRIEAPVPGKGYVGIEVPNTKPSLVSLRDILDEDAYKTIKSRLRVALGRSVDGHPIVADLTTMPHLLIAGTTGSGKSVCVNAIITTLLLENSPDELRFIMVDPKRVELTGYNGIPHMVEGMSVVVDLERIVGVLKWVTREMEERYKKFAQTQSRNIADYNARLPATGTKIPYLVVVIDELADLMMLAPEETEKALARLAQMARATGIHLIVSTQRPSVDVVTGLIKANFPARISFAVASSVDSRVILDQPGAEKLLGRGDMLYQAPDAAAPMRCQGVYLSDNEIDKVTRYWKGQRPNRPSNSGANGTPVPGLAPPNRGVFDVPPAEPVQSRAERLGLVNTTGSGSRPSSANAPKLFDKDPAPMSRPPISPSASGGESDDDLYDEAVKIYKENGEKIGIQLLQRRLRVGYLRASNLIDLMKKRGLNVDKPGTADDPTLEDEES